MKKIQPYFNNLSNDEYCKYARHLILEQIGVNGQQKLKNSKILFIGAGGLSSPAMLYLAASGIGYIGIIENDIIEISNLNRQILYDNQDIKKHKIYTAKYKLKSINKDCKIITHSYTLNTNNAIEIIKYYHIIIDGSDNFITRYLIEKVCQKLHKIHIYGGIQTFEGQLSILNYKSGIQYSDIYPKDLNLTDKNCNNNGLLGVITGTIGILQATETTKIILGIGEILDNFITTYNLLSLSFNKIKIYPQKIIKQNQSTKKYKKNIFNILSNTKIKYIQDNNKKNILIIDIRENYEFTLNTTHLTKAINIPLNKIYIISTIKFLGEYHKKKLIILYCPTSYRSLIASNYLKYNKINHYILENYQ
uniref:Molybdopterin biosynthesis protein n=1 Tax=Spermothamnion repens TaxID=31383 RepID=A0A4D6WYJ2_9FLOR|nr:Molybdopterin biosynthesis protein [Spermothamnion repens]